MESLRGTGYSLETALADLIDNSVAAGAKQIDLVLDWNEGDPIIVISDDGSGMNEGSLVAAMRFGCVGPQVYRSASDLGRFGLGLKTASLSQCRRLTVSSRQNGGISVFCWDLDHVRAAGGSWELLEGVPDGLKFPASLADQACGTIVIWDRVDFGRVRERPTLRTFLGQIERAERHLAMVFHRYLYGDARRIRISINGRRVKGWDPFLEDHEATIARPEQVLDSGGERIRVRGFILPHPDRFANVTAMDDAAGPEGWVAQQGFYVYRQKRLLSAGGWLGMGGTRAWTREEFGRLARIRIDLPNTIDEDWRIDIRKAQARPPELMRPALARIAEDVRKIARDVFFHRGHRGERGHPDGVTRIWHVNPSTSSRRYTIQRDHPLLGLLGGSVGDRSELLDALLDLIERTVPVDRICFDAVESGPPLLALASTEEHSELFEVASGILRTMMLAGLGRPEAVEAVSLMEPFNMIPEIADRLSRA
jgi:Histidine kinase-, DNA gyrase B-, and HSP90-like ATPase